MFRLVLSVDVWDDLWPDQVKRDVIAAAPIVHRKKGTVEAVEAALSALGIRSEITEWWQAVPEKRHGTFEVIAFANLHLMPGEVVLSELVQFQIMQQIRAAKPKSRSFEFQVGGDFKSEIGATTAFVGLQVGREAMSADRNNHVQAQYGLASGYAQIQVGRFDCIAAA